MAGLSLEGVVIAQESLEDRETGNLKLQLSKAITEYSEVAQNSNIRGVAELITDAISDGLVAHKNEYRFAIYWRELLPPKIECVESLNEEEIITIYRTAIERLKEGIATIEGNRRLAEIGMIPVGDFQLKLNTAIFEGYKKIHTEMWYNEDAAKKNPFNFAGLLK